jgi:hypothetical protein
VLGQTRRRVRDVAAIIPIRTTPNRLENVHAHLQNANRIIPGHRQTRRDRYIEKIERYTRYRSRIVDF